MTANPTPNVALLAGIVELSDQAPALARSKKGSDTNAVAKKASRERTCEEQAILSKRGRGNRVKGASGEREWCSFAAPWFPGMERNLSQCRGGGRKEGGDVKGSALCDLCHIEIKRGGNTSPKAAMKQAIADNAGKKIPAVATRDDRGEWLMTFRAVDLLPLLQEALAFRSSVAIELVVGTEEDEAEAEKALSQSDAVARTPPLFGGAA